MIPTIQHVRDHAVQTPWVEDGDLLVAAVACKMQIRNEQEAVYDLDTFSLAEDPDLAYELHEAATIRLGRVRYLERKERLDELEAEKALAVDTAVAKLALEVERIGSCLDPAKLSIWLALPPVEAGVDPAADVWPPSDPTTTPPLP